MPQPEKPPAKRVESLGDYVALWPLLGLFIGGGAWLKAHAHGFVESGGLVLAALGGAGFLWNLVPEETRKKARLDFGQHLKSRRLARGAWWALGVALVVSMFVSSVHVTAAKAGAPVRVFRMNGSVDGASSVGGERELSSSEPSASFLVLIPPIGRRQWLRTETEERSREFRLFPFLPRTLLYPEDFSANIAAEVLPMGSFIPDFGGPQPLRLLVRADGGRGDTLAVDSLVRIETLVLSVAGAAHPDTALARPRWVAAVRRQFGVDERDAEDQVRDWMRFREVRTRRALKAGETIGIVVLSPVGDTVAADTVTLSAVFSDVILRRRTN